MSSKVNMLATSGLTALVLLSTVSAAEARTHHKAAHKASHAVASNSQASEISELKAQIQALSDRLEANEAGQRITADQAASASAQTADLGTKMAANQAAIAGQVKSAISANAPKANWTSETKVTGRMYFNISNINQQKNGVKELPSGTGFDIKRLYVGVEHTFNKNFSSGFVVDAQASEAYAGNANLAGTNFYIKNAWLQYKYSDALAVRVGASDMPWIPFAEGITGTRYIDKTVSDRAKLGNSADWGVHASGLLGNAKGFNVTYAASAVNGGGYKNPTRSNSVDLEGRVAANYKGFTAAVGGYTGKLAADAQGVAPLHTASRVNALLAYVNPRFRIGGEYFWAKDFSQSNVVGTKSTTTPGATTYTTAAGCIVLPCAVTATTAPSTTTVSFVPEDVAEGFSVFGTFNITPKWSVFGRYDIVKPNKYTSPALKGDYYNVGVTYSPAKIVDLSLVYKRDQAVNGSVNGTNGKVGGTINGTADEIGLYGQIRF